MAASYLPDQNVCRHKIPLKQAGIEFHLAGSIPHRQAEKRPHCQLAPCPDRWCHRHRRRVEVVGAMAQQWYEPGGGCRRRAAGRMARLRGAVLLHRLAREAPRPRPARCQARNPFLKTCPMGLPRSMPMASCSCGTIASSRCTVSTAVKSAAVCHCVKSSPSRNGLEYSTATSTRISAT